MFPTPRRRPSVPSARARLRAVARAVAPCLVLAFGAGEVRALDDQWYVGLGGSASLLYPDSAEAGFEAEDELVPGATLFVGRDLDERSSAQLQLRLLGEAEFEGGETVDYLGGDASVLYRFFDTRDTARPGTVLGLSLYGRFGLGFLTRDSDVTLENDPGVHFGAGAGVEAYLTRHVALRAEGVYHDTDASSLALSLVTRFGGRAPRGLSTSPPRSGSARRAPADRAVRTAGGTAAAPGSRPGDAVHGARADTRHGIGAERSGPDAARDLRAADRSVIRSGSVRTDRPARDTLP